MKNLFVFTLMALALAVAQEIELTNRPGFRPVSDAFKE